MSARLPETQDFMFWVLLFLIKIYLSVYLKGRVTGGKDREISRPWVPSPDAFHLEAEPGRGQEPGVPRASHLGGRGPGAWNLLHLPLRSTGRKLD